MKRILSLTTVFMLLMILCTACSAGPAPEELAGTWKMTSGEASGQTITMEQLSALGIEVDVTLVFDNAKKVEISMINGEDSIKDTLAYTYENGAVTVEEGGDKLVFNLENDTLRLEAGGAILVLERQAA